MNFGVDLNMVQNTNTFLSERLLYLRAHLGIFGEES